MHKRRKGDASAYRLGTALPSPNPYALLHRQDEYLAVAYRPGTGALDYGLNRPVDKVVVDGYRKPYLLLEVHLLQCTTVHVDIAALLATPQGSGHGYLVNLTGKQGLLHRVQTLRLDVGNYEFHDSPRV